MGTTSKRNPRPPEEIMNVGADNADEKAPRPKPKSKRVASSVKKSQCNAIEEMFFEAKYRDSEQRRPWCALADGAEHQLEVINTLIKRHGARAQA